MLALAFIRQHPDEVRQAMLHRGEDPAILDRVLELDSQYRAVVHEQESLRSEQNLAGKQLASQKEKPPALLDQLRQLRERIRALEERGVIQGYGARIDRQALGLTMTVIVHVGLRSQNEDLLKSFEEAVARAPSVVSCRLMSGEDDYLVTVMARDLADFERIHKEQLSRLPGVARLKSSFVLRDVAEKTLPESCLLPSRK